MKNKCGNKAKEISSQPKQDQNKMEIRMSDQAKPNHIPNPVKGLSLSLYSMNKEH